MSEPARSSSPGLGSEDDEIDKLMRSSPPPEDDELPDQLLPDGAAIGEPSASTSASQPDENENGLPLSGVSRNEQAILRRAAEKLKLHPYQCVLLQYFVKCSPAACDAQIMMAIFDVDNRLEQEAAAAPPFMVSEALHAMATSTNYPLQLNIKSFIIAVLLSAKLAAYKGTIPRDHVLSLIMKDRLHIPPTFDRDPHAAKLLKERKLKKLIKSGNDKNIFDLATSLVNGTSCTVTIQLCGRVALFRKMFAIDPNDSFWDTVDDELVKIRTKAQNNPVKIMRYFKAILEADQKAYLGDNPSVSYTLPTDGVFAYYKSQLLSKRLRLTIQLF
ncbi:hypothetical protein BYT27DRAFT_7245243 [Phlegmacium glaucopus]|nr:hypothetical protein BYT27DRAFT_7245243 [Phlegmacium glaucopus]